MFGKAGNSKKQGDMGLSIAIAHYVLQGATVSLPLTDSQPYDLIIDTGSEIARIQVKTSRFRQANGFYVVTLATRGGTRKSRDFKRFEGSESDYVFIATDDGRQYIIPSQELTGKLNVVLNQIFTTFLVQNHDAIRTY